MKGPISEITILIKNKVVTHELSSRFVGRLNFFLERRFGNELTKNLSTFSSLSVMLLD